jgi:hypothetical protein
LHFLIFEVDSGFPQAARDPSQQSLALLACGVQVLMGCKCRRGVMVRIISYSNFIAMRIKDTSTVYSYSISVCMGSFVFGYELTSFGNLNQLIIDYNKLQPGE